MIWLLIKLYQTSLSKQGQKSQKFTNTVLLMNRVRLIPIWFNGDGYARDAISFGWKKGAFLIAAVVIFLSLSPQAHLIGKYTDLDASPKG